MSPSPPPLRRRATCFTCPSAAASPPTAAPPRRTPPRPPSPRSLPPPAVARVPDGSSINCSFQAAGRQHHASDRPALLCSGGRFASRRRNYTAEAAASKECRASTRLMFMNGMSSDRVPTPRVARLIGPGPFVSGYSRAGQARSYTAASSLCTATRSWSRTGRAGI